MPNMTDVILVRQPEQATITIRTTTKVQELPGLIGGSYAKIAGYLGELGEMMSDVPFVCYHNMDMQALDVEIGFPVAMPLPERREIRTSSIPEGFVVFCMYRGPYSEMASVYDEMAKWINDNGFVPIGTAYEFYYNGPDCPESELLTKVMMPVLKK